MPADSAIQPTEHSSMQRLVFASHNPHKMEEIRAILGPDFLLSGLDELGCDTEIPEPYDSLVDNAMAKARFVARHYGCDCFADDTGLEVDVLGGLPGVQSARFAGPQKDSRANVNKLLTMLSDHDRPRARFRTIIALILEGREYFFEGRVEGVIIGEPRGDGGFGYDPVFVPDGQDQTFAEMDSHKKNRISHRKQALAKLAAFLRSRSTAR